eukprot:TRINITY_DN4923_c0_g1_i2.p1 TRINITY_DN4923_c0_g1~~TRINITY_DN4923_c0_g1_i2.p1  ORF type:complete len:443 (+),score=76.87 TRINITY_DN4923_c0_g1_i2:1973-3301(+)
MRIQQLPSTAERRPLTTVAAIAWPTGATSNAYMDLTQYGADTDNYYRFTEQNGGIDVLWQAAINSTLVAQQMLFYSVSQDGSTRLLVAPRDNANYLLHISHFRDTITILDRVYCAGVDESAVWQASGLDNSEFALHGFFATHDRLAVVSMASEPFKCTVNTLKDAALPADTVTGMLVTTPGVAGDHILFIAREQSDSTAGGHILRWFWNPEVAPPIQQSFTYLQQGPAPVFYGDDLNVPVIYWLQADGETGYLFWWEITSQRLYSKNISLPGQQWLPYSAYSYGTNFVFVASTDGSGLGFTLHSWLLDNQESLYQGGLEVTDLQPPSAMFHAPDGAVQGQAFVVVLTKDSSDTNFAVLYTSSPDSALSDDKGVTQGRNAVSEQHSQQLFSLHDYLVDVPPPPSCSATNCGPTLPCPNQICCCEYLQSMFCCYVVPGAATCVP